MGDSVTATCARKLRESAPLIAAYRPDKPSNTVCKATETQCRDSKGAFKCLAGKVCCPPPYVDECPLGEQCSSTTKTCVSRCDEEAGLFWCPCAKKCIDALTCCPDFPDDW